MLFIHLSIGYSKRDLFGLSFILFILKWSAGKTIERLEQGMKHNQSCR